MSEIKLTIHSLEESGTCSLSGKEGEVIVLSFDDGTITKGALSQKSLMQLVRMKLAQPVKKPTPAPASPKPRRDTLFRLTRQRP